MSCVHSGATPTASTALGGGERWCPPPERGDPSWQESPMESRREGTPGPRTILSPGRTRGDSEVSWVANRSTWAWPNTLHICFTTSGWSLLSLGLGPTSTGCLLPDWDAQECELLSGRGVSLGPTGGSGAPACKGGMSADLPGGWWNTASISRQLMCQTPGWAATHDRSPTGEGGVHRLRYAMTRSSQHRALRQEPSGESAGWQCKVEWKNPILVSFAPESKPQELPVLRKDGNMEVCVLQIYRDKPVLGPDLRHDLFECKHLELQSHDWVVQLMQI